MIQPDPVAPDRYRLGYREGFHDGYDKASEQAAKAEEDKQRGGAPEPGNGGGGDGGDKKPDAREDSDKPGDDKPADKAGDGKAGDGKKDGEGTENGRQAKEGDKPPLYKRPLLVGGVLLVVLLLIVAGILFWRHSEHHESTDDAFIDGQTSQVAAQTSGRVTRLYVADNQLVKAGDPLLDIDSRDADARTLQSRAQLATSQGQREQAEAQVTVQRANAAEAEATARQAESDLAKASQDAARYRVVDPDAVPRQDADNAEAALRTARAKLDASRASARAAHAQVEAALAQVRASQAGIESARAQLSASELQGSYTHVVAPVSGRIARRAVDVGNVVANGQALLALVSDQLWVTANYKETQLTRMQPGQSVEITVDAYPDVQFRGHVDSIQRATGAYFSMLPAENATGNYVKVVQRVPVKIVFDDDRIKNYAIGPGMSVSPDVSLP